MRLAGMFCSSKRPPAGAENRISKESSAKTQPPERLHARGKTFISIPRLVLRHKAVHLAAREHACQTPFNTQAAAKRLFFSPRGK